LDANRSLVLVVVLYRIARFAYKEGGESERERDGDEDE
jgi:hypothetical protein